MKVSVIGENETLAQEDVGRVAFSAHQLARAGFPVPYSLVFSRQVFEEFLVESQATALFFSFLKKGKIDKAASLIQSTDFPPLLLESIMNTIEEHKIKEFLC